MDPRSKYMMRGQWYPTEDYYYIAFAWFWVKGQYEVRFTGYHKRLFKYRWVWTCGFRKIGKDQG